MPATKPAWDLSRKNRFFWNLGFIGLLWVDLFFHLSIEWELNPQYGYGYMVPFLGIYLLYSRWEDRPTVAEPPALSGSIKLTAAILVVLALLPLRLVFEANPDWRLLMIAHATLIWLLTLGFTYSVGGRKWLNHFFWATVFLLIAVPWPSRIEGPLVQGLMRMVAFLSVEFMNFLGIHAQQAGNLIRLPNTLVGVEEACSGVRSFQSAIMAGLFFGEFFRYRLTYRVGLIAAGILLSILLNLIRTFTLTFIAHRDGADAMQHWHDPVGYFVYFGTFALILALAYLLRRVARHKTASVKVSRAPFLLRGSSRGLLPVPVILVLAGLWGAGVGANQVYYGWSESPPEFLVRVDTDYSGLGMPYRNLELADAIRAQLRYQEGEQVVWADPVQRQSWTVFFFTWDRGDVSSFVGVHRPEICLQAAGLVLTERGAPLTWSNGAFDMVMDSYTFRSGTRDYHVFFAVWEMENGRHVPIDKNYDDRLRRVREGIRSSARQSLQIVVTGTEDLRKATEEVVATMNQFVEVSIEHL